MEDEPGSSASLIRKSCKFCRLRKIKCIPGSGQEQEGRKRCVACSTRNEECVYERQGAMGRPRGSINKRKNSPTFDGHSASKRRRSNSQSPPAQIVFAPLEDRPTPIRNIAALEEAAAMRATQTSRPAPHRRQSLPDLISATYEVSAADYHSYEPSYLQPPSRNSFFAPPSPPFYAPPSYHYPSIAKSSIRYPPPTETVQLRPLSTPIAGILFRQVDIDHCFRTIAGAPDFDDLALQFESEPFGNICQAFWSLLVPDHPNVKPRSTFLRTLSTYVCKYPPVKKEYVPFQPQEPEPVFFTDYLEPDKQVQRLHSTLFHLFQGSLAGKALFAGVWREDDNRPFDLRVTAGNPLDGADPFHVEQALQVWFTTSPLAALVNDFTTLSDLRAGVVDDALASQLVGTTLRAGRVLPQDVRPFRKAMHEAPVYGAFAQDTVFGRPFSEAAESSTPTLILYHIGLEHLHLKKYRKAFSMMLLANLSARRYLRGKEHLLDSHVLCRETAEAEQVQLILKNLHFWVLLFGLGLGIPFEAMNEMKTSLPICERNFQTKSYLLGRHIRLDQIDKNIWRSLRRVVETARLARAIHNYGRELPFATLPSPRLRIRPYECYAVLAAIVHPQVLQFLCDSQRDFRPPTSKAAATEPIPDELAAAVASFSLSHFAAHPSVAHQLQSLFLATNYLASLLYHHQMGQLHWACQKLLFRLISASLPPLRYLLLHENPHELFSLTSTIPVHPKAARSEAFKSKKSDPMWLSAFQTGLKELDMDV